MKQKLNDVASIPFVDLDVKLVQLSPMASQAEGSIDGTPLVFTVTGFDAMVWLSTGEVADTGVIAAKIQESSDGETYDDLYTFPTGVGANAWLTAKITITKPYLKFVGTVTGGGSGTVETESGILY